MVTQTLQFMMENGIAALAGGGILVLIMVILSGKRLMGYINMGIAGGLPKIFHMALSVICVIWLSNWAFGKLWASTQAVLSTVATSQSTSALASTALAGAQLVDYMIAGNSPTGGSSGGNLTVDFSPPLVNNGGAVSFASQPAPVPARGELVIETAADAVAAFMAMDVTPTPVGGGLTYINQFIADNVPTVEVALAANGSYTVKGGDSLAKIAKAVYGDSGKWRAICNANRNVLRDCNSIRAGTVLVIPAGGGGGNGGLVAIPTAAPVSWGQQTTVYVAPAAPVAPPQPARNLANDQVVINTNNDAVQAIQALGPLPTVAAPVAVAPTPTPRAVYTYAELKGQQTPVGGGMAYINQFLADQKNPAVASGN